MRLKYVADIRNSNVDKKTYGDDDPVRLCNYTNVYHNEYITGTLDLMLATATEREIERFSLCKGDVIITKDSESWDDIGIPACVAEDVDNVVCGYHLTLLRPDGGLDGRFLLRALRADPVLEQLHNAARGVTRYGLSLSGIRDLEIPLPPPEEQRAIAADLDRETARIDALIAAKRELVARLGEKRQALVARAVTRGLDPDAPTRDSGVPWIGEVPAHWDVERGRWLFTERDQRSEEGDEEMLSVSHLTGVTKRSEKDVNMFEAKTTVGYKVVRPGDLAINTLWAWMGAMGTSPHHGIVSPAYHVYEPGPRLTSPFVDALVRTERFVREVTRYSKGVWSSRLRLYPAEFFDVRFPVPSLDEQRSITAEIERQSAALDAVARETRRSVDLLKERRAALISATVTGQRRVLQPA